MSSAKWEKVRVQRMEAREGKPMQEWHDGLVVKRNHETGGVMLQFCCRRCINAALVEQTTERVVVQDKETRRKNTARVQKVRASRREREHSDT
jgi:hypothetical protein